MLTRWTGTCNTRNKSIIIRRVTEKNNDSHKLVTLNPFPLRARTTYLQLSFFLNYLHFCLEPRLPGDNMSLKLTNGIYISNRTKMASFFSLNIHVCFEEYHPLKVNFLIWDSWSKLYWSLPYWTCLINTDIEEYKWI